jgi:tubby-related protein 1
MWVYRDDLGNVQGPFTAEQMRAWFQDGYFNAETIVKLATEGDDAWVELGLLFPEGEGAFLSEGDQIGAKAKQAQIDAEKAAAAAAAASSAPPAFDYGYAPPASNYAMAAPIPAAVPAATGAYDPNVYDYSIGQGESNPFDSGAALGAAAGGAAIAWGTDAAFGAPPPPAYDPNQGGKDLYSSAIGAPPPALGAGVGAPPSALQAQESDDWGITWDDEGDDDGPNTEATPITVAETDEEPKDDRIIMGFAELEKRYLSSVDQLYLFLTRSLPKSLGVVQCKIKRSCVGLHMSYNLYELYLERGDNQLGPQILIAQKHRKYAVDSYYNIAIGSVNKTEAGKVISSLVFSTSGTNFVCHNHVPAHKGEPRDLACVHYQKGTAQKQPRKFSVAIPALQDKSETEQVKWPHKGSVKKSLMLQSLSNLEFKGLQPLVNKKPTWSAKHKAWVLNFHGRVTRSSVKNFQLVRPDDQKDIVLQFGRTGADTFTMDMQWPISPVAAFAVAVSSLHAKLRVD